MKKLIKSLENQSKIEEIDSIRGIAAFLIVIYHMPLWGFLNSINLIRNGYLMVELFFVLSGFIIFKSYSSKLNNIKDLLLFQFLRFGRLYPVHIFFLLIYVFIEFLKYYAQHKFGIYSVNSMPFSENNINAFIQNIFLIQAIGPLGKIYTFNGPSWSISVEFYTYFIFGLIILYLEKYKIIIFWGLLICSLFLILSKNDYGYKSLFSCYLGFFLGCLVAHYQEKIKIKIPKYLSIYAFIAIVVYLVLKTNADYDPIIYILSAFLILTLTMEKRGYLNSLLKINLFSWLGKISFSIYMSHFCIIWFINQFLRIIVKKQEVFIEGKYTPLLTNFETLIIMSFTIVIILIISNIVYKYIENPFRLKSREYFIRASVTRGGNLPVG